MLPLSQAAFAQPTSEEIQLNPSYWGNQTPKGDSSDNEGYFGGMRALLSGAVKLPSPAGMASYWDFEQACQPVMKPHTTRILFFTFVNTVNTGYDGAVSDATLYVWINDPDSPHNKVS